MLLFAYLYANLQRSHINASREDSLIRLSYRHPALARAIKHWGWAAYVVVQVISQLAPLSQNLPFIFSEFQEHFLHLPGL